MIETRRSFGVGLALLGTVLGCGGDDGGSTMAGSGLGAGGAGGIAYVPCPADNPEFGSGPAGIGLEAVGMRELAKARVIKADPPHPERFENDWSVALMDARGAPLADAQVTSACAYMPVHGHSSPARAIMPLMDPGTVLVKALDLSMPGPWEVELTIHSPSLAGTADLYTHCDSGMRSPGVEKIILRACVRED
jgi:hypothetical protein